MTGRPMVGQSTLLQKESAHGTPLVNAMLRVEALKMRPAFDGEAEPFKGLSGKVTTSVQLPDLTGAWSVEAVQCFNAIGLVAASRIAVPVTTTPGGATDARQHVFTLDPDAADAFVSYTAQFGDSTQAMQANYGVFQSLGLEIQRGTLGLTTSFLSREPATGATLATTGVTTMAAAPIPSRAYDVYVDPAWVDVGTTKALACYQMNVELADKYTPDAPINSAIVSYESAMESEDQDYTFDSIWGFDAVAVDLISAFKDGSKRYFRVEVIGPEVESGVNYMLTFDFPAFVVSAGEIAAAPNSPATTVPIGLSLADEDGDACVLTLVNGILAY